VQTPDTKTWAAADHKFAFTITRERRRNGPTGSASVFVARVSCLDGSYQRKFGRKFKTFKAAARLCSNFTRAARRQTAYHEAGHAVVAHLLGFTGVWVDMEDNLYRAITRHDFLPTLLTVADDGFTLPSPITCIRI